MKSSPPIRGFTLIELMLVLLIMGTFAAMILPSVATSVRSNSLDATTGKVHELLNFASLAAISRHKPVVLNIDTERRRCWVTVRTTSLPWIEYEQEQPQTRTLTTIEIPDGTHILVTRPESPSSFPTSSGPWETITFQSDGSSEDAIIELTDQNGELREIQLVGSTGEVIVKEEEIS